MVYKWEDALTFLAASNDTAPTSRDTVHDDDKPWINKDNTVADDYSGWQGQETGGTGQNLDSWVAWFFKYTTPGGYTYNASYVVGAHILYPNLDGPGAKLAGFTGSVAPLKRMYNAVPRVTDSFNVLVFGDVANALTEVTHFLDGWVEEIGKWANTVASKDSDWQGSAAGAFRAVLLAFRNEIDADRRNMARTNVQSYLTAGPTSCDAVFRTAMETLMTGWNEWWASPNAWPTNAVTSALTEGLKDATLEVTQVAQNVSFGQKIPETTGTLKDTTSGTLDLKFTLKGATFGDPKTTDFWTKVEARARAIWVENIVSILDKAAETALGEIAKAYGTTSGAATPLKPFPLIMPTPKKDETDPTKDDKTDDIGNPKIDDPTLKTSGDGGGGPDLKNMGGPDLKNMGGPDLKNPGGPDLKLEGNGTSGGGPSLTNLGLGSVGTGTGSGNGTGSGTGLDLIGNPSPGGGLLPDDLLLGGGGSGRPVTVPPGSVITKDGRIVDENGNPVLDSSGNPMVAGPNYTIGPDGTLRDDKGNTVSQYRQLLADRYSGGGGGGDDLLTPSNFGPGGFSYGTGGLGGLSGSGSGGLLTPGGGPMITGMGGGLSSRALASGGDPNAMKVAVDQANAERMAAEKAARAAAQEQALLTGRQTATSSGGMPPMMPPGGGMGGQGGPNDKDRRRTTWLAEDEETWGTETGAVHGVIGR
ncbi:hypothetical protein [Kitasatospora sp. NPDC092286]|uniref:hypothetical protein n=1 Tax=Kitasatospora sp. NPDC092286 TaxID=3364087 RepID=UPI0037FF02E9